MHTLIQTRTHSGSSVTDCKMNTGYHSDKIKDTAPFYSSIQSILFKREGHLVYYCSIKAFFWRNRQTGISAGYHVLRTCTVPYHSFTKWHSCNIQERNQYNCYHCDNCKGHRLFPRYDILASCVSKHIMCIYKSAQF